MATLFDLIEAHRNSQPYPPSLSRIAQRIGVARQTVSNWREPSELPDVAHLQALADVIGVPYLRVLDAALVDTGYTSPGTIYSTHCVTAEQKASLLETAQVAANAAGGDSNDSEIESLQDLASEALGLLGLTMPEPEEKEED